MRFSLCTGTKKKNPQLGLIRLEYLQIFKNSKNQLFHGFIIKKLGIQAKTAQAS